MAANLFVVVNQSTIDVPEAILLGLRPYLEVFAGLLPDVRIQRQGDDGSTDVLRRGEPIEDFLRKAVPMLGASLAGRESDDLHSF